MDLTFVLNGPVTVPAIITGLINCAAFVLLVYFIAQQKTELIIMLSLAAAITLTFTIMFVCLNYADWLTRHAPNPESFSESIINVIVISILAGLIGAMIIDLVQSAAKQHNKRRQILAVQ